MPASPQIIYARTFGNPFAGQLAYARTSDQVVTRLNKSGGTLQSGLALVAQTSNSDPEHEVTLPSATTVDGAHAIVGIGVLDMATDPNFIAGTANTREGETLGVLVDGFIWVVTEQVCAPSDPVFVRCVSGTGTTIGAFRKDADTATARQCFGARWVEASTGTPGTPGTGMIYFSAAVEMANCQGI